MTPKLALVTAYQRLRAYGPSGGGAGDGQSRKFLTYASGDYRGVTRSKIKRWRR